MGCLPLSNCQCPVRTCNLHLLHGFRGRYWTSPTLRLRNVSKICMFLITTTLPCNRYSNLGKQKPLTLVSIYLAFVTIIGLAVV